MCYVLYVIYRYIIILCYMSYDTCYTLYDKCYLFSVFYQKIASKNGQKLLEIVVFQLSNRSIFGPKGGFKSEKLKDQKCASHGRQKQNRQTCLSNGREAPYMYGYVNALFKPDTTL